MAPGRTNKAQRNNRDDHEWPEIARKHPGEDYVYTREAQHRAHPHVGNRSRLFFCLTCEAYRKTVVRCDIAYSIAAQQFDDLVRCCQRRIRIGRYRHLTHPIFAPDTRETTSVRR